MKRLEVRWIRVLLALVALGGVALLSACEGNTTVNNQPAETSGITVSGHGEVDVAPDLGFIDIGVTSTATTVADAREKAASAADAVISAIKKDGVDSKDIQTTGLSIQPNYDYTKSGGSPTITGYTVSNTVEAKVRKLDGMSKTLDDAIAAGGNDVRLQTIRFGIDDESKPQQDARDKAMADAKAKAEQLAKLGGVSLGAPVTISETQATRSNADKGFVTAPSASGGTSTPIETGTNTVSIDVSVRFSIK